MNKDIERCGACYRSEADCLCKGEPPVRSSELVVPLCDYCLQAHGEDDGCKCAECGCGLHPQFIRTAIVNDKPNVLCPNCDAEKRHNAELSDRRRE